MKSRQYLLLGFFMLCAILTAAGGPPKASSVLKISGSVSVPRELQERVRGSFIVLALRDADTHVLLQEETIVGPDTMGTDTGKVLKEDMNPCYKQPGGCPFSLVMKTRAVKPRRCIISVEIQDSLYRSTRGLEGCSRILGYYTGSVPLKGEATGQNDVRRAKVIRIDSRHASYTLKLDVR